MQEASLLRQNPTEFGGILGCALRGIARQNHLIPDVLSKLADRMERTHSSLRGHAAVVVPMFRAQIMIALVDCHGKLALRSELLGIPFFHLFDFFDISKCSHHFRL